MSLQQLQAQRATFISAWQQGKITLTQRDIALAANQKQIDALQAQQVTVAPATPQPQQQVSAPLPPENPGDITTVTQTKVVEYVTGESLLTLEQKGSIEAELTKVRNAPSTNDEALAKGFDYYIPIEQKTAYEKQIKDIYTQTVPITSTTVIPVSSSSAKPTIKIDTSKSPLKVIPTNMGPIPVSTFEAGAKDPTMQNVVIPGLEVAAIAGLSVIPGAAPIVIGGAVAGVGLDVGVKSVSKSLETGEAQLVLPKNAREVTEPALVGAAFSVVGAGAFGAVAKVAPTIAGKIANPIVRATSRVALNTGLSGGVSGVVSGGDPKAIAEGALLGAGLGFAGEIAGPIAIKAGSLAEKTSIGKAVGNIKEDIIGSKFTEITGAKEVFNQTTMGKETTITRVTQPEAKTVTLRGEEARLYKANNLETMKNPVIEFEGSQRVKIIQQDAAMIDEEITTYPKVPVKNIGQNAKYDLVGDINKEFGVIESVKGYKATELPLRDPTVIASTRSAKPILEAIKGKNKTFEKITPIEETKLTITKGRIYSDKPTLDLGIDKPITVVQKTARVGDLELLPTGKSASRQLKTVRVYDKPSNTADIFARATGKPKQVAETADLFERTTGKIANEGLKTKASDSPPFVSNEQINILKQQGETAKLFDKAIVDKTAFASKELGDISGPMKPGSNDFFRNGLKETNVKPIDEPVTGKPSETITETLQTGKGKGVSVEKSLPRAIVGEAPKTASRYIVPTAGAAAAITFTQVSKQNSNQQSAIIQMPSTSKVTLPKSPIGFTPTVKSPVDELTFDDVKPIVSPIEDQVIRPNPVPPVYVYDQPIKPINDDIIKPIPDQPIKPIYDEVIKPIDVPIIKPIDNQPIEIKTDNTPIIKPIDVPISKPSRSSAPFRISLGGGAGGGDFASGKASKWYVKKHKVKTASQMLKTFGVGEGKSKAGFKTSNIKMAGLSSKQSFKAPTMKLGNIGVNKVSFKTPNMKLNGVGIPRGFKAPNMQIGKTPSFKATGFSSNQFNKMFQQPKQKRRR